MASAAKTGRKRVPAGQFNRLLTPAKFNEATARQMKCRTEKSPLFSQFRGHLT